MVFDASVALTWILFMALFPRAFFWRRCAWRILVWHDFSQKNAKLPQVFLHPLGRPDARRLGWGRSEVALKYAQTRPDVAKWAPYEMLVNAVAGVVVVCASVSVLVAAMPYQAWSAVAGSTIWCKFLASFALSRHAHAELGKKRT